MSADDDFKTYDSLSPDHAKRLAAVYTEMGVIYQEADIPTLARIAALQAAWFRTHSEKRIVPL